MNNYNKLTAASYHFHPLLTLSHRNIDSSHKGRRDSEWRCRRRHNPAAAFQCKREHLPVLQAATAAADFLKRAPFMAPRDSRLELPSRQPQSAIEVAQNFNGGACKRAHQRRQNAHGPVELMPQLARDLW